MKNLVISNELSLINFLKEIEYMFWLKGELNYSSNLQLKKDVGYLLDCYDLGSWVGLSDYEKFRYIKRSFGAELGVEVVFV